MAYCLQFSQQEDSRDRLVKQQNTNNNTLGIASVIEIEDAANCQNSNAYIAISPTEYAELKSILDQNATFDYAYAAQIWAFAFCLVVGLWATARAIGSVINMVRDH